MTKANSKSSSKKVLRMFAVMLILVGYVAVITIPFVVMLIFDKEVKG